MKNKAILFSLTAAGLCMFLSVPAQAQGAQQATINNLHQIGARIVQAITTGQANGTLSAQSAAELNAELARIQTLTSQYANDGNGLTFAETQQLTSSYGQLEARVNTYGASNNNPFRGGFGGGNTAANTMDVEARINQMQAKVSSDLTAGAISNDQAYNIRTQIHDVFQKFNNMKADGLSSWERSDLISDLDQIDRRMGSSGGLGGRWSRFGGYSSYRPGNDLNLAQFDARQTTLLNRISQAQAAGQLSQWEYNTLKSSYDQIQNRAARFRTSGSRLSRGELNSLENRQDQLDEDITRAQSRRNRGRR